MRISVGSVPSSWGLGKLTSFYRELGQSPADYVYVGETSCPNRSCSWGDWISSVCGELTRAGKEVYASSLGLVRDETEYRAFDELAQRVRRVEINSPAFLGLGRSYPAVTGAFLNVYNSAATNILARNMVNRIVLPCELGFESIISIAKNSPVAVEVVVHGHIPVAISYDCHTARCFGRSPNECKMLCQQYPEGMILEAGHQQMFRIEGPQTLSAATYCLVEYLAVLEEAGIDTVRVLPQWDHTGRILRVYRDVLDHRMEPGDALEELKKLSSTSLCNGWFLEKAGWVYESPN